jgi:hypothetical protein
LTYFEPINRRFFAFAALIDFIESLPSAKQSPSDILDFPEPFAPIMTLIPLSNGISVLFAKLLKPCSTILFIKVIGKGNF